MAVSIDSPELALDGTALTTFWTRAGNWASVTVTGAVDLGESRMGLDQTRVSSLAPDEDLLADVAEVLDENLEEAIAEAR